MSAPELPRRRLAHGARAGHGPALYTRAPRELPCRQFLNRSAPAVYFPARLPDRSTPPRRAEQRHQMPKRNFFFQKNYETFVFFKK